VVFQNQPTFFWTYFFRFVFFVHFFLKLKYFMCEFWYILCFAGDFCNLRNSIENIYYILYAISVILYNLRISAKKAKKIRILIFSHFVINRSINDKQNICVNFIKFRFFLLFLNYMFLYAISCIPEIAYKIYILEIAH
jgi:hypothetical protein